MANQQPTIENWEIDLIEKQWLSTQPRVSDCQWFQIFPEAQPYLEEHLKELNKKVENLASEIRKMLKRIYQNYNDEFSIWFGEKLVEVWLGDTLDKSSKEVHKLEWLLSPPKQKGNITEQMIERAREYPFKDLIESKRNFALCPFHSDEKPSLYLKNNWGNCFSCGWHGDTIKFVMERDNLSFAEAIKRLT